MLWFAPRAQPGGRSMADPALLTHDVQCLSAQLTYMSGSMPSTGWPTSVR